MKYIFAASLTLLLFLQTNDKHLGEWESDDGYDVGYLILDEEGYATLKADGQVMGGKSAIVGGVEAYMLYEIDYDSSPIEIDFIIHNLADDEEMGRLKGIMRFIDDNSLKLVLGFKGKRPESFEDPNVIIFTRK